MARYDDIPGAESIELEDRYGAGQVLAGVQSFGNVIASNVTGLLYTAVSASAAFVFPAAAMVVALPLLAAARRK